MMISQNEQEQLDTDGDGIGDNADLDDDNDGIEDYEDYCSKFEFGGKDTDGDGI